MARERERASRKGGCGTTTSTHGRCAFIISADASSTNRGNYAGFHDGTAQSVWAWSFWKIADAFTYACT